MPDPWAQFHLEEIETEPCIRYRYEQQCVAVNQHGRLYD